eukprot:5240549-Heterocapsa_arctica.AAC.1
MARKVRLVLDLRRSRYNEYVRVHERIVLPRLKDLVDDAKVLGRSADASRGEKVFVMIADFEDAFHSLG